MRAIRDDAHCLRRFIELVRFAEAYRISTDIDLNYSGVTEPMMLCAADSSSDDREHAADLFEAVGKLADIPGRVMRLYPIRRAVEDLRADVRPWSLLSPTFRQRIDNIERDMHTAGVAASGGFSWETVLSPIVDELRDHEWPRVIPPIYVHRNRFSRLHPDPEVGERARIAEEVAGQAEVLILGALGEGGALDDVLGASEP